MYKNIIIISCFFILSACGNNEPNKAKIFVYDVSTEYSPTLKIELDDSKLLVQLKMAGETLIDSVHELDEEKKRQILLALKTNGIKIYSQETPEWKNIKGNDIAPAQFNQMSDVFYPELEYVLNYHYTLYKAANSLNKLTPSFLEKRDTFAAD